MTIHISNKYVSPKWPGKLERKIDIYVNGVYKDSSCAYTSCKNAKLGYNLVTGTPLPDINAIYSEAK